MTENAREPVVWRSSPWRPALVFLVAAGFAAPAIYAHLSVAPRLLFYALAAGAAVVGVIAARAFLVMDADGIGVRKVMTEVDIPWSEFDRVDIVRTKYRTALVIVRRTDGVVEIPSSLVLPVRPTNTVNLIRRLEAFAAQVQAYGEPYLRR